MERGQKLLCRSLASVDGGNGVDRGYKKRILGCSVDKGEIVYTEGSRKDCEDGVIIHTLKKGREEDGTGERRVCVEGCRNNKPVVLTLVRVRCARAGSLRMSCRRWESTDVATTGRIPASLQLILGRLGVHFYHSQPVLHQLCCTAWCYLPHISSRGCFSGFWGGFAWLRVRE